MTFLAFNSESGHTGMTRSGSDGLMPVFLLVSSIGTAKPVRIGS